MARWRPDPSFYASPRAAMEAPPESACYVALLDPEGRRPDEIAVVDLEPSSSTYGEVVGRTPMPGPGDELHHFGWNACSSALCPYAPHPHVERRYLLVPGLRSSHLHVLDTKPDPYSPTVVDTIDAGAIAARSGYSRPHTIHCGPDAIYVSALGAPDGGGPGGIFLLDHDSFEVLGRWEVERGPQFLAYDFWWHLGFDTLVTSEWGTPDMVEGGVVPDLLLGNRYGHAMHVWDLRRRRHVQRLDLGPEHQMVLELRPAHDPTRAYGFVGVVVDTTDLSGSVWLWHRDDGGAYRATEVITVPAEPAEPEQLPELLKPFGAVPPLITDITLSLDDRYLYVSCWGTGELRRYDVSDPWEPRAAGSVRLGGIAARTPHPDGAPLGGGPQMVEVSRDGRRVYVTNSLYLSWDAQFYPEGIRGWLVKLDADDDGLRIDPDLRTDFGDLRSHQVRLFGGDSSSDSYCFP